MTNYEVMFIIDAALEDEKKDATVETVQSIIAADGRRLGNEKACLSYQQEGRRLLCSS